MKLLDYILISVALLHSCNAARYTRQTENCPLIHAKDPSACVGAISECWSPGQLDVDCQNGAGVCCFNGCVNVCGVPKVCKTVHETRYCIFLTSRKHQFRVFVILRFCYVSPNCCKQCIVFQVRERNHRGVRSG